MRSKGQSVEMNPFRRWREERGLDHGDAAKLLGMNRSYLCQVERGDPRRLGPRLVEALTREGADGIALAEAYVAWRHRDASRIRRRASE